MIPTYLEMAQWVLRRVIYRLGQTKGRGQGRACALMRPPGSRSRPLKVDPWLHLFPKTACGQSDQELLLYDAFPCLPSFPCTRMHGRELNALQIHETFNEPALAVDISS